MKTFEAIKSFQQLRVMIYLTFATLLIILLYSSSTFGQEISSLYTARGYWQESGNNNYQLLLKKRGSSRTLTGIEQQYLDDFEKYLDVYFSRLSSEEKTRYRKLKDQWDLALATSAK